MPKIRAMAISDSLSEIEGKNTWIIENVEMSASKVTIESVTPLKERFDKWPLHWAISNTLNGVSPDGKEWSPSYVGGCIWFKGILKTKGSWS